MDPTRVLALVLAGGNGTRLLPLTAECAKPALPFAAGYRIVDFVLSNLVNSGVSSIYVLAQYKPQSLVEHIRSEWAPWRDGKRFIEVVLPATDGEAGSFKGTSDAVYQNLHLIERHRPDLVAVFASDHVYRMDVGQMACFHQQSDAQISIAAVPVPIAEATQFGIIATAQDGRVAGFQEKPERPAPIPDDPSHAFASMGNYLLEPRVLAHLLEQAHGRGETDFGRHILPRAWRSHRVFAYDFRRNRVPGLRACEEPHYWRDVGTLAAYTAAQADATGPKPRFDAANARWPVRADGFDRGAGHEGRFR
jgi:glucose-1-phosphate adenylyltransferase